jgi:hypothetical protein
VAGVRKANGLNIGKRLRSLGYQAEAVVANAAEPSTPEVLPDWDGTEADEFKGLGDKGNTELADTGMLLHKASSTVVELQAVPGGKRADLYLLRGLLRCGLCDEPFACCLMGTGIRYYGCTNIGCVRPLVNAEEVEQVVWKGFVLRFEAQAEAQVNFRLPRRVPIARRCAASSRAT